MTPGSTGTSSYADLAAFLILLIAFIVGLFRGLSGERSNFCSYTVAIFFGFIVYPHILANLYTGDPWDVPGWRYLALVFDLIASVIVFMLGQYVFERLQCFPTKSFGDRIGGGIASFLQVAIVLLFLFIVGTLVPQTEIHRMFGTESRFGRQVITYEAAIQKAIDMDITGVHDTIMLKREEKTKKNPGVVK